MQLTIDQHDDDTTTIEGTRYANIFFRNFGCSFPGMVGQTLRIDKKEDGLVTVTRIADPAALDKKLLLEFADRIMCEWTLQQYWDGEPCERATDPERLVNNFLAWRKDQAKN